MSSGAYSLIAHANAFLHDGVPMPDWQVMPDLHVAAGFEMGLYWNRSKVFGTPQQWADWLRASKVSRVRLFIRPDGGGSGIETDGEKGQMIWRAGQRLVRERTRDDPIETVIPWVFVCRGEELEPSAPRLRATLDEAEAALRSSVGEIIALCDAQRLEVIGRAYRIVQSRLDQGVPVNPVLVDVFPKNGYGPTARRLFAAARAEPYFVYGLTDWHDEPLQDWKLRERYEVARQATAAACRLALVATFDSYGHKTT